MTKARVCLLNDGIFSCAHTHTHACIGRRKISFFISRTNEIIIKLFEHFSRCVCESKNSLRELDFQPFGRNKSGKFHSRGAFFALIFFVLSHIRSHLDFGCIYIFLRSPAGLRCCFFIFRGCFVCSPSVWNRCHELCGGFWFLWQNK